MTRHRTRKALVGGMIATLAIALGTSGVAGTTVINMTTDGATQAYNGVIFQQGPLPSSAGTGVLDPFIRVGANKDVIQGYNTDYRYNGNKMQFDEDPPWTDSLLLSTVPIREVGGTLYRVFFLDINQVNSVPDLSLDQLKLFLGTSPTLHDYDPLTEKFGGVTLPKIFDLGDAYIHLNYALEAGSGDSDMTMLVPETLFDAAGPACDYGQAGCGYWLYFWNLFGKTFINNDGFEEWSTEVLPFVQVDKTAVGTFDRNYSWTLTKDWDGEYWKFIGDPKTVHNYKVVLDQSTSDSNIKVSGNITLTVPDKLPDGEKNSPDAVIKTIADIFDQGGTKTTATVTCPSALPFTIKAGSSVVCTYTLTPPTTAAGVNTATVEILDNPTLFTDTAAVASFTEKSVGYKTVNVTDSIAGALGSASADTTFNYTGDFACPTDKAMYTGGVYTKTTVNTATITETGQHDSATVKLNCYLPVVSKTAAGTYTNTYSWTIDKTADGEYWKFIGDPASTHNFKVVVDQTITPSAYKVAGTISITNPNPNTDMVVALSDVLSSGETATLTDCTSPVTVAKGTTKECKYEATPTSASGGTNTATATLNSIAFAASKAYTFTAGTVGDATVTATDTNTGYGGPYILTADKTVEYTKDFGCPTDKSLYVNGVYDTSYTNTANIKGATVDKSDTATVKLHCYLPLVSKDANPTYTRTYDWNITKKADQSALTLKVGQTFVGINYEITVNVKSYTDSERNVTGTITVKNPNPKASMTVSVADVISSGLAATVDCGLGSTSLTVAASGTGTCSYSYAGLPDLTTRLNTATATLNSLGFTGTANVVFGAPTKLVDECIDVWDDNGTPATTADDVKLGTVCYNDTLPKTFKFQRNVGPYQLCGDYKVTNTAWFVKIDTKGTGEASWTININVPCEGCTLTQGYWKTHSEYGPAPYDDTWALIGEDTQFFGNTGVSWYQMFWMAPKGGNPYIQLAHQWQAAYLNSVKSVDPAPFGDLQDEFDAAKTLLAKYTWNGYNWKTDPDGVAGQFRYLAGLFGSWNEGIIGPGHCSEDATSSTAP